MTRLRSERHARWGSAALATGVTVVFAYLAVRDVDFAEIGDSLRESNYGYLAPALVLLAVGFAMRAVRWRLLFSPASRPALWPATQALLVAQFLNNVLPFRAGDAARIVALRSLGGPSRVETAGTVVIERVFDVLALLLLLFVGLPWFPEVTWIRAAGTLAIALLIALGAAIVVLRVYGERAVRFGLRPLARLPFLSPNRVEAAVRNLTVGVIALRSMRLGLVGFAWTLLSWCVLGFSFWFVMLGFDLGLSPAAGLLVVIATGLSLLLPSAPAAVGVFEAAAIVVLAAYDVPRAHALSYALVVHGLNVLPFVAAGLLVLNLRRGLLRPSTSAARRDERLFARGSGRMPLRGGRALSVDRRRSGDDEDDVAEPAHRNLDVDEAREPR
jgi:glycosyltransferase 2 family protein